MIVQQTQIFCLAPKVVFELNDSGGEIVDSLIVGRESAIQWMSSHSQNLKIDNSFLIAPSCIYLSDNDQSKLQLVGTTCFAEHGILLDPGTYPPDRLFVEANRCIFLATESCLAFEDTDLEQAPRLEQIANQIELVGGKNLIPAVFVMNIEDETDLGFVETDLKRQVDEGSLVIVPENLMEDIDLEDWLDELPEISEDNPLWDIYEQYPGIGADPEVYRSEQD